MSPFGKSLALLRTAFASVVIMTLLLLTLNNSRVYL